MRIGDRPQDRRNLILAMRARRLIPKGELIKILTPREAEVMRLRATGLSTNEVAGIMGISVYTVRTHIRHAYERLGLEPDTPGQAAVYTTFMRALRELGWLQVPE